MWTFLLFGQYLNIYTFIKVYTVVLESLQRCLASFYSAFIFTFSSWNAPITINLTLYVNNHVHHEFIMNSKYELKTCMFLLHCILEHKSRLHGILLISITMLVRIAYALWVQLLLCTELHSPWRTDPHFKRDSW